MTGLLQTEQTNAVNTGLVGKADKSASSLKGNLYEVGKRGHTQGAGSASLSATLKTKKKTSAADGSTTDAAHAAVKKAKGRAGGDVAESEQVNASSQSRHHLAKSFRGRAKTAAARRASHTALEDSELEGADDFVYGGKSAHRTIKSVKKRLSSRTSGKATLKTGKDALDSESSLGALSEKKYRKKALGKKTSQQAMQFTQYFKKNVYETAAVQATKKKAVLAAGGGLKAPLAAVGAALAQVLPFILCVLLIIALVSTSSGEDKSTGSFDYGNLTGVELDVAKALASAGLSRAAICGVMGNISGESGWSPTAVYSPDGDEYGYGLFQFTDKPSQGLYNYTRFANWCTANGKQKETVSAQVEYFLQVVQGSWMTFHHVTNHYNIPEFIGKDCSFDAWKNCTDVALATYAFMACYERPAYGAGHSSYYSTRLPKAKAYYEQITPSSTSGGSFVGGEEYDSAEQWQKNIVDAAYSTGTAGPSHCAMWVQWVYNAAGVSHHGGNGNSMLSGNQTSTDWAHIKIGQLVSAQKTGTSDGAIYGHVAIYVGNGTVRENCTGGGGQYGYVKDTPLSEWVAWYSQYGAVFYGWPF